MLFFTDYGNVAKVARCNMDGTNRTQLVDYRIELPTAVALDVIRKLVYWADAYLDYIDVVDYDGKNRHSIVHGSKVSVPFRREHSFPSSVGHTSQVLSPDSVQRVILWMGFLHSFSHLGHRTLSVPDRWDILRLLL